MASGRFALVAFPMANAADDREAGSLCWASANSVGPTVSNGFVLIVQGGFEIGQDARITDMAERSERHDSWAGKWIDGQAR